MTTTFTDKKGRTWDVALDLLTARRVDASDFSAYIGDRKFSILEPEKPLIHRLISDAPFMFAVIWAMVQEQAANKHQVYLAAKANYDQRGNRPGVVQPPFDPPADCFLFSPKENPAEAELEFVSGVNGPTIKAAREAIVASLSDFFPELQTVLSLLVKQFQKMETKAAVKLQETEPLLEEWMDEEFEAGLKKMKEELRKTREERLGKISTALQPQPT